jgi:uncharacterized protein YndB with AHSA1/START domain
MSASQAETLRFTRRIAASREKVFRAWTEPQELMKWWQPNGFTAPSAEIDLREGGRYRIAMQPHKGPLRYLCGQYLEVRPPERLVMTWSSEGSPLHDGYESLLTVEFISRGAETTEVTLTHERLPGQYVRDFDAGWLSTLDRLGEYLGTQANPPQEQRSPS